MDDDEAGRKAETKVKDSLKKYSHVKILNFNKDPRQVTEKELKHVFK